MLELSRTIRFCLNDPPPGGAGADSAAGAKDNTFAAWPAMRGLGRYYELDVTCRGEADPTTGYFLNIKHIDRAVHEHALPCFHRALAASDSASGVPMGGLMRELTASLGPALRGSVQRVGLQLTPTYEIAIRSHDMDHVTIRQLYEFSAAHRLHVPELSDEENRKVFGKCNNPAGHGHNYRLHVTVRVPIDAKGGAVGVEQLDALVNRHAVERLDHKHLNRDVPQFAELNPSVENIVRVVWDMLDRPVAEGLGGGASLQELSVWETSKTVCTYRGPGRDSEALHR
jgi:6-pyruvoyltetrahydropterin/6-carboxytetrahydropterin synthase